MDVNYGIDIFLNNLQGVDPVGVWMGLGHVHFCSMTNSFLWSHSHIILFCIQTSPLPPTHPTHPSLPKSLNGLIFYFIGTCHLFNGGPSFLKKEGLCLSEMFKLMECNIKKKLFWGAKR